MATPGVTAQASTTAARVALHSALEGGEVYALSPKEAGSEYSLSFGPYQLFPRRRLLLRAGKPLQLGARALDILILLAERQGDVVGKNELIARAWPGVSIEENALRVAVAGLRKALDDGSDEARYIKTIPARGYCLIAPAARHESGRDVEMTLNPAPRLPLRLKDMVGRADAIRAISSLLETRGIVTVLGPGGVGKTTTAVAVAHAELEAFAGAVHMLDLGQISEAQHLPAALASVLGLPVSSGDPTSDLLAFLRGRRMLLVFDSCEHLIEPVATLIERIFHEAPQVCILATSREMLRVDGEQVYRLSGLDCPLEVDAQSAEHVLSFAAPRLFANRVAAGGYGFDLSDADARVVAQICRKLDGLALAIDVAAARVQTFGLSEIACSLETRCWLLWRGRRTALPRHQTVSATIDWSYDLLSEAEQAMLRSLAIFRGPFTLEAAREIARGGLPDPSHDLHIIDRLVAKSLLSFEAGNGVSGYRLLNSTRAYALEKLRQRGEFESLAIKAAEWPPV